MTTKTIYIAQDGECFDKQSECEQYEADGCVHFESLPNYGQHLPLTPERLAWMRAGDGDCYYATATKMTHREARHGPHPDWATHLIYFGK